MKIKKGFTLIEIVIWMALFIIITSAGVIALNPSGQLAKARNTERQLHMTIFISSIRQVIADTPGSAWNCSAGALPTSSKKMATGAGNYDMAQCLVPTYLVNLPFDPSASGAHWTSKTDYNTGYNIFKNATTSEITVSAPGAELNQTISITR